MKDKRIDEILDFIKSEGSLKHRSKLEKSVGWVTFLFLTFLAYIDIIEPKVAIVLSLAFNYSLPTYSTSDDRFYYYYKQTAVELYLTRPLIVFFSMMGYFLYEYLFNGWYTNIYWMYLIIGLSWQLQATLYKLFVKFIRSKHSAYEFINIGTLKRDKAISIIERLQESYQIKVEKTNMTPGQYILKSLL